MTVPPDPRAKELFLQALELPDAERARWLAARAGEDPHLVEQVRALLLAHDGAAAAELERLPAALGAGRHAPRGAVGETLGDYQLLEEVGSGAFGAVWRARQVSLDRVVALKVLRAGRFAGDKELERLRAEAEAVARLDHPGIVPVYEVGEHDGQAYFSMKWIGGGDLARRLEEPWNERAAARLCADVARAVHHAHQRGLLHRDLKPSNVLLDEDGRPHVADFGIAKRLDGEADGATTRVLMGTPAYMAPEQAAGEELTVATDVWALGCILHELLAARPAFGGDRVSDVLRRIRAEDPPRLRALRPELARDLETIVAVCLRKDPGRRYASASALADDLERWLEHEPIAARRTSGLERVRLFCLRSPMAASLIGLAAGLLVLLAAVATWASVELGARLRESLLGQARAVRLSGTVGAREAALELLARAAAIRRGEDVRDEAIACLALTDLARVGAIGRTPGLVGRPVADASLERLAVQDERGLRILDLRDGQELARLAPASEAGDACWSPGGRWLLTKHHAAESQERDAGFRIWDVAAGRELLARSEAISFSSMDFAPGEQHLAYGTFGGALVVLELPSGAERLRLDAGARTGSLAYDPEGERLAVLVGGGRDLLQVRASETGELLREVALPCASFDVAWTSGGRDIAVAGADLGVHVFEEDTLRERLVCAGHVAEVIEVFGAGGLPFLLSSAWDGTARLWDLDTGREVQRLPARALGFSAGGTRLAFADAEAWSTWRLEHGDFLSSVAVHEGKSPRALCVAPDGRIASVGPDGVYQWSGRSGDRPERLWASEARAACYLPDGRGLLLSGPQGLFRLDLEPKGEPRRLLAGPLWGMAASADGRALAVQGAGVIHRLDPEDPDSLATLPGVANMEYLAASADAAWVAAGNWNGRGVSLWGPGGGVEPRVLLPEQRNVAVALSPDGRLLAAVTNERLELFSTGDGARLLVLPRRADFGNSPAPVAFGPDGTTLAFALSSATVRLIDATTLRSVGTLEAPLGEGLFDLAFSPDGTLLAAACSTNRVHLWHLAELARELDQRGLDASGARRSASLSAGR